MGGAIAALAARDDGERVRALALNDPALRALIDADPGSARVNEWTARVMESTRKSVSLGNLEDTARTWTDFLSGEGSFDWLPPPARAVRLQNAPPLVELSDSPQPFTCEDAKRIRAPTLLIRGERTVGLFQRIDERLAQCLPHSESEVVPNATHEPYWQNPTYFNNALLRFIEEH